MGNKTESVVCGEAIEQLEQFNGERMCQDCYQAPENEVFD